MVKIAIYYTLLFITLFLLHWYRAILWQSAQPISIVKLAAFPQENLALVVQEDSIIERLYPQISYYCKYEKRRKRKIFINYFISLNLKLTPMGINPVGAPTGRMP